MTIEVPETPCVVIDEDIMRKNLQRMADVCREQACALRPHIKTHKIPQLAKLQLEYGACGITVAKLSEAEVMADHGIDDIFVAYPVIGPANIQRAVALARRIRLIVAVDSVASASALADAAQQADITLELRLEVDTGMRRTGVLYDDALEVASRIAPLKGICLQGIFTFRGLIYNGKTDPSRSRCGLQEGQIMAELANHMRAAGINIVDVSTGSTPTAEFNVRVPGVTEVRPGTYIFNDMMQLNTHACADLSDIAARVLTTVISTCKEDMIVINGGCKSFSTDVALEHFPYFLHGHGTVVGHEGLYFDRISEEHGMLQKQDIAKNIRVEDQLEIIPNHICPVINMYDHIYLVKQGVVIQRLDVAARGKNY